MFLLVPAALPPWVRPLFLTIRPRNAGALAEAERLAAGARAGGDGLPPLEQR